MKLGILLGTIPIALGAAVLAIREFEYETDEHEVEWGPVKATTQARTHVAVPSPAALGGALIGAGAGIILAFWLLEQARPGGEE
ncbi:MAG TPA: hypothetical protein VLV83_01725 [Acidobacteriota bacterium]|nr:hypothetical protein [Acidobacteriota bacterium]